MRMYVLFTNFSAQFFKFMLKSCLLFCKSEIMDAFSLSVEQNNTPRYSLKLVFVKFEYWVLWKVSLYIVEVFIKRHWY